LLVREFNARLSDQPLDSAVALVIVSAQVIDAILDVFNITVINAFRLLPGGGRGLSGSSGLGSSRGSNSRSGGRRSGSGISAVGVSSLLPANVNVDARASHVGGASDGSTSLFDLLLTVLLLILVHWLLGEIFEHLVAVAVLGFGSTSASSVTLQ
jgi:hypothetical protein